MFQESSLDFKLVQRVCLLQQALDQAKASLDEMQEQVANHQMLQAHLVQTEEYSNVQQKIIVNLQQQLEAQHQWQSQVLDQLLAGVKGLVADQQLELERLRVRIYQGQAEVQDYLVRIKNYYQGLAIGRAPAQEFDLNSEVMIARSLTVSLSSQLQAAQQHIQHLDNTLTRHQVTLARMQSYVNNGAGGTGGMGGSLPTDASSDGALALAMAAPALDDDPVALKAIIEAQRQKITELSAELGQQFNQQTTLKYRCQAIAAERDGLKQQAMALSLENEALHEQIWYQDDTVG
jgi:predicted  nucleic acid-binding Zn-ribbon protein